MTQYELAVEFEKCSEKDNPFCIEKLRNKKQCESALAKCSYPIRANPLCFCHKYHNCQGRYNVINKNSKIYIFYQCVGCQFYSKGDGNNKILDMINSPLIYYGKSIDKLIEKLQLKTTTTEVELESLVHFFDGIFKMINMRV
jgi:hypothetical protein